MWYYDINEEDWSPVSFKSSVVPSPRSEFAHSRYQDDFIIFGGKGDNGLYNDIYRFNTRDRDWKLISVETATMPSARRAACMAAADDFILIYGGIEASGYSNELWKFDWGTRSYSLLNSSNSPPKSAFSQCHIETNTDNQIVFKVYMGETEGDSPVEFLYEYNISLDRWTQTLEPYINTVLSKGKSALFMIDNTFINAGGSRWNYDSFTRISAFNLEWSDTIIVGYLPAKTYYGASVYYKNSIYIHGGAYSFGDLPLRSIVKNNLIVINLNEQCEGSEDFCISSCSKGTYHENEGCELCPKGSYSDKLGSDSCSLCRAGYFSDIIGAETAKTCKPCPYGFFTYDEGQSMCLNCPNDSICYLGEIKLADESEFVSNFSIQPDLLDYQNEIVSKNSKIIYIIISLLLFICLVMLLNSKNTQQLLTRIDIYSKNHNYEEGKPLIMKKTLMGGIFTTAFLFAALAIISSMFLSYSIDNIRETKALVPLAALENQYDSVISIQFAAEQIKIDFELKSYGGICETEEGTCTEDIEYFLENIEGILEPLTCKKVGSGCNISLKIKDFDLTENGKVNLKLSEPESFCSAIFVKIETSSSIPNDISGIKEMIFSDGEYLFRGSQPSTFSYLMTPSLFKTDSNMWEDNQSGYHISVQTDPVKGSQAYSKDIQYTSQLNVEVNLYKNWAVLYTQRLQIQHIGTLLSNLAGSILGILGALRFLMVNFEKQHIQYMINQRSKINLSNLIVNRKRLFGKNFNSAYIKSAVSDTASHIGWSLDWFRHRLRSRVQDITDDDISKSRIEDVEFNYITK